MSGGNYPEDCPNCGAEEGLNVYSDHKPFTFSEGTCGACGFWFGVKTGQMSLKELNDHRKFFGAEKIKRRKRGSLDPDLQW